MNLDAIPFVQAKHFNRGRGGQAVRCVVIHTMEAHERADTAENVASYFAGATAPAASAHYCIDNDSIVQCVKDEDTAWHASTANPWSIGLEHAGFAKQTPDEWNDDFSQAMLRLSAQLAARLVVKFQIPVRFVDAHDLPRTDEGGFTGHVDVNHAFNCGSHYDPGPSFPWSLYLAMVQEEVDALGSPA